MFTNWGSEANQSCAILDHYNDKWFSTDCQETHRFVCKWNNSPQPTTAPPGDCPGDDWQDIGGQFCYHFGRANEAVSRESAVTHCVTVSPSQMSWSDARSACSTLAGPDGRSADLPSVHSQAEEELLTTSILSQTGQNVWLGLARGGDGAFSWVDGSGLDYEFWADGEPNGSGSDGEDCVELYTVWGGKWNDAACSDYKGVVCMANKRKPGSPSSHLFHHIQL